MIIIPKRVIFLKNMPKKSKSKKIKSNDRDRDEETGRDFRVVSPLLVSPPWSPSRAALRAMERVYGKHWREITYHSMEHTFEHEHDSVDN